MAEEGEGGYCESGDMRRRTDGVKNVPENHLQGQNTRYSQYEFEIGIYTYFNSENLAYFKDIV